VFRSLRVTSRRSSDTSGSFWQGAADPVSQNFRRSRNAPYFRPRGQSHLDGFERSGDSLVRTAPKVRPGSGSWTIAQQGIVRAPYDSASTTTHLPASTGGRPASPYGRRPASLRLGYIVSKRLALRPHPFRPSISSAHYASFGRSGLRTPSCRNGRTPGSSCSPTGGASWSIRLISRTAGGDVQCNARRSRPTGARSGTTNGITSPVSPARAQPADAHRRGPLPDLAFPRQPVRSVTTEFIGPVFVAGSPALLHVSPWTKQRDGHLQPNVVVTRHA
jgi:hypothetical protein